MRQRIAIIVTVVVVLGVLIAINAASYQREDERQDTELSPNRSSYHSGATGTRALYDFLSESGYPVMRWREVPAQLLVDTRQKVQTFVIIGDTALSIDEDDARSLLLWVERGGRLVLVDRRPEDQILPPSGHWVVATEVGGFPSLTVNPGNVSEMTENVKPIQPLQPTLLTQKVEWVMPSRYAATISFTNIKSNSGQDQEAQSLQNNHELENEHPLTPKPVSPPAAALDKSTPLSPAPVVHLGDSRGALLVDYPHGNGRIVVLSDPYIVSNGGLSLRDNLQLAINLLAPQRGRTRPSGVEVTKTEGLIAFDEYHQGRGTTRNDLIGYFSGTPILPLLGQSAVLVLVILWTSSRRFGRSLPLKQIDRRSSLEFVASMAELQQRARAYDLAIENVYSRTRRVLARYAGMDYNSQRAEIASRVAARSSLDPPSLEVLMRQCEEAINGAPVTERQAIQLVKRLRDVERALGLRMRERDARQATQRV
ncbi:MAG: DUF4350 domain-containing protein [Pyrinomonadaceae bacterium]|nr:DUF4350 domain-containing protein [Pyrinomonadaceae bacterium]